MTETNLNDWYSQQGFDTVRRITGINLWNYPDNGDLDDAIDEARGIWDAMNYEDKLFQYTQHEGI